MPTIKKSKLPSIIISAAFAVIVFLLIIICIMAGQINPPEDTTPTPDIKIVGEITEIIDIALWGDRTQAIIEINNELQLVITVKNDRALRTGLIVYDYHRKKGFDRYRYE